MRGRIQTMNCECVASYMEIQYQVQVKGIAYSMAFWGNGCWRVNSCRQLSSIPHNTIDTCYLSMSYYSGKTAHINL